MKLLSNLEQMKSEVKRTSFLTEKKMIENFRKEKTLSRYRKFQIYNPYTYMQ